MFYMQRVTLDDICVKITKTHSFKAVIVVANDIRPIICAVIKIKNIGGKI